MKSSSHRGRAVLLWLALGSGACAAAGGDPDGEPAASPDARAANVVKRDAKAGPEAAVVAAEDAMAAPSGGTDAGVVRDAASVVDGAPAPDATFAATDGSPSTTCAAEVPICLNFEGGSLPAGWQASSATNPALDSTKAASGQASLHFAQLTSGKRLKITSTKLTGITDVMWGRAFLWMTPKAPNGHGALVNAYDQSGNFYEVGFQFGNYHGNWHPPEGVPERWMNSTVPIPGGRWVCMEWLFDGATPAVTKIFSDGVEVKYSQSAGSPGPKKVTQFAKIEIGFIPYHGSTTTDLWLDDIAIGPKRIGCAR